MAQDIDVPTNNPAARLYHLLDCMLDFTVGGNRPAVIVALDFFHRYPARVEEGDAVANSSTSLKRFARLQNLAVEAWTQTAERASCPLLHLQTMQTVKDLVLSMNSVGLSWNNIREDISDALKPGLAQCAIFLSESGSEKILTYNDEDKLWGLVRVIEPLLKDVLDGNFPEHLRCLMADHLRAIRCAIIEHDLCGNAGTHRALEGGLGAIALNLDELTSEAKIQKPVRDFMSAVAAFGRLLKDAEIVTKLPDWVESKWSSLPDGGYNLSQNPFNVPRPKGGYA